MPRRSTEIEAAVVNVFFDEKGAIGRRYRRQDEAGTPFGITVDGQTLQDETVTFRDRDTGRQWRVPSAGVVQALRDLLEGAPIPGWTGGRARRTSTGAIMVPCISQVIDDEHALRGRPLGLAARGQALRRSNSG